MPDSSPRSPRPCTPPSSGSAGEDRPGQLEMATRGRGGHRRLVSTCWSRPAPAPASRSPTSCPASCTTSASSWPRQRSRCSTSSSSATSRPSSTRVGRPARRSVRRTPCSRAAATTRACTAIRDGVPDDQGALDRHARRAPSAPRCSSCAQWAEEQASDGGPGDRDSAPSHTDRVWQQVSVSHRECLGATKCPYASECFAERARERAMSLEPDRHQPLAARHRRDRGRADDPRLRRRGRRRGARARQRG